MMWKLWGKKPQPKYSSRRPRWEKILNKDGAKEKLKKRRGRKSKAAAGKPWMRTCSRCRKVYHTISKYSKICDDCKLPFGFGKVKKRNEVKKDGRK